MRSYVRHLIDETITTVARGRPNTIVSVTDDQVLIETATGHRNHASLTELQRLADRVFDGDEVAFELRGRSAFYAAVLDTLPEVEILLRPRRARLRRTLTADVASDAEYAELFPDEDQAVAREGRLVFREHRARERNPALVSKKKATVRKETGVLACEACGFDFATRYGDLGDGFVECHHTIPLASGEERTTSLASLALLCANCHRMIHRSKPMLTVAELRDLIRVAERH